MANTICPTIKANMFFNMDEMYYKATVYSMTHNISFKQAQIALYGKVYFDD